jgi:hypothetical protein
MHYVAAPSYERAYIAMHMHYIFNAGNGNGYWIPTRMLLLLQPQVTRCIYLRRTR